MAAGEELLAAIEKTFFGPMRVSVMLDSNGANTTAAAAVLCAGKHCPLKGAEVAVLAATGPVGSRVALLLALAGAKVRVASRKIDRAAAVCQAVAKKVSGACLTAVKTESPQQAAEAVADAQILIAAGAPGVGAVDRRSPRGCEVAASGRSI